MFEILIDKIKQSLGCSWKTLNRVRWQFFKRDIDGSICDEISQALMISSVTSM